MGNYYYFVSYRFWSVDGRDGYGDTTIITPKIKNPNDIKAVQDYIKELNNFKALVILCLTKLGRA